MSTNGLTSWAVDLANIGAIYPFQGTEVAMVVVGVVFWVVWHIIQIRQENAEIADEMAADPKGEKTSKAIERF
jgi:hypothetical protein